MLAKLKCLHSLIDFLKKKNLETIRNSNFFILPQLTRTQTRRYSSSNYVAEPFSLTTPLFLYPSLDTHKQSQMTCTIPVIAAPISQMQAALFSIVMAGDEPISFQQLLLTKYMILTEIWMFAGLLLKASTDWRSNIHSTTSPNILQLWCMCIRPQVLSVLTATRVQCLPVWCLPIWWL